MALNIYIQYFNCGTIATKFFCTLPATSLYTLFDDYDLHITLTSIALLKCTLIIYFFTIIKHKREKIEEAYIVESRISKKLHDEIANELYGTINQVEKLDSIPQDEKDLLLNNLNSIYNSSRNISRETATINTGTNYPECLKTLISGYNSDTTNVIIKDIDIIKWDKISCAKKITLYRALQELMVNMKKHSMATVIILEFNLHNKTLNIKYKDNGIGLTQTPARKNGLQNVENRMETINGKTIFENATGTGFHLTLSFPAYDIYV